MKYAGKIVPFLLLVMVSCTGEAEEKNITKVNNFPEAVDLKGYEILSNEFKVATFQIIDSLIVVSTGQDTIFHIYSKNEQHINSFGRKGKGPNEFQRIPFLVNIWKEENIIKSLIYDEVVHRPIKINFSKSLETGDVSSEVLGFPSFLTREILISQIFYLGKEKYIGLYDDQYHQSLNKMSGGFIYDLVKDNYQLFPMHNLKIEPFEPFPAVNLNNRKLHLAPNRTKLFTAMIHAPIIEKINVHDLKASKYVIGNDPLGKNSNWRILKTKNSPNISWISMSPMNLYICWNLKILR